LTDLTKISSKVLIGVAMLIFILLVSVIALSYGSDTPFLIDGKPNDFGSQELKKKTTELEDLAYRLSQTKQKLEAVESENGKFKEANVKLLAQQQALAQADAAIWYPVDDIEFQEDGTFSTLGTRQGKRKWSHQDSELNLHLVALEENSVVLGTNLPAPGNKLRIQNGQGILVPMSKWEYRVTVVTVYSSTAEIRVERRLRH
jgi:hypothetical protein